MTIAAGLVCGGCVLAVLWGLGRVLAPLADEVVEEAMWKRDERRAAARLSEPTRRESFYDCERLVSGPGWDRLRSGAAQFEAWRCQLEEIRHLPTVEPNRRRLA